MIFVLYRTFVLSKGKTRKVNPETMYFCFRVLYFQKYKKTITFSKLGEPGLYFLGYLEVRSIIRSFRLRVHACVIVVEVVDNTSS